MPLIIEIHTADTFTHEPARDLIPVPARTPEGIAAGILAHLAEAAPAGTEVSVRFLPGGRAAGVAITFPGGDEARGFAILP